MQYLHLIIGIFFLLFVTLVSAQIPIFSKEDKGWKLKKGQFCGTKGLRQDARNKIDHSLFHLLTTKADEDKLFLQLVSVVRHIIINIDEYKERLQEVLKRQQLPHDRLNFQRPMYRLLMRCPHPPDWENDKRKEELFALGPLYPFEMFDFTKLRSIQLEADNIGHRQMEFCFNWYRYVLKEEAKFVTVLMMYHWLAELFIDEVAGVVDQLAEDRLLVAFQVIIKKIKFLVKEPTTSRPYPQIERLPDFPHRPIEQHHPSDHHVTEGKHLQPKLKPKPKPKAIVTLPPPPPAIATAAAVPTSSQSNFLSKYGKAVSCSVLGGLLILRILWKILFRSADESIMDAVLRFTRRAPRPGVDVTTTEDAGGWSMSIMAIVGLVVLVVGGIGFFWWQSKQTKNVEKMVESETKIEKTVEKKKVKKKKRKVKKTRPVSSLAESSIGAISKFESNLSDLKMSTYLKTRVPWSSISTSPLSLSREKTIKKKKKKKKKKGIKPTPRAISSIGPSLSRLTGSTWR